MISPLISRYRWQIVSWCLIGSRSVDGHWSVLESVSQGERLFTTDRHRGDGDADDITTGQLWEAVNDTWPLESRGQRRRHENLSWDGEKHVNMSECLNHHVAEMF